MTAYVRLLSYFLLWSPERRDITLERIIYHILTKTAGENSPFPRSSPFDSTGLVSVRVAEWVLPRPNNNSIVEIVVSRSPQSNSIMPPKLYAWHVMIKFINCDVSIMNPYCCTIAPSSSSTTAFRSPGPDWIVVLMIQLKRRTRAPTINCLGAKRSLVDGVYIVK